MIKIKITFFYTARTSFGHFLSFKNLESFLQPNFKIKLVVLKFEIQAKTIFGAS